MKITANRLTLLRILLLPLPCLLLYGGPEAKVTALGVGSLLGLTDYFDGRLARRQGVTRLGTLLDPIADKIFVTVIYLVLSRLGYLPLFLVAGILWREFLVTALRQFVPGHLPVSWLAKTKTALQMLGAAVIVLVRTFPAHAFVFLGLSSFLMLLGLLCSSLSSHQKKRLFPALLLFPLLGFLPGDSLPVVLGVLVLGLTWLSAITYFKAASRYLSLVNFEGLLARVSVSLMALFLIPKAGPWWLLALFLLISELIREALSLLLHKEGPPKFWMLLGFLGIGPLFSGGVQMVVSYLSLALIASLCEVGKLWLSFYRELRA